MPATRLDVMVEERATFELTIDLLDSEGDPRTDLTGATGAMQIREDRDDTSDLIVAATVEVDASNSQVTATITAAVTAGLDFTSGWYELRITNQAATRTERVAHGVATFSRGTTT